LEAEREKGRGSRAGMVTPHGEEEEGVWQRDVAVRGGGGPAPAAMREWRRRAGVGRRARAGAGARDAGRWAGLRGGVQLAVGKGGYDRWARAGERKERKRKRIQFKFETDISNLFELDSIQTDLSELRKFEINYGWKVFEISSNFSDRNFLKFEMDFELKNHECFFGLKFNGISLKNLGTSDFDEI
jgi:hypothetical protein